MLKIPKTIIQIEKRFSNSIEVREDNKNNKKEISGYALKWEQLSEELGYWFVFREKFRKGSFREYLSSGNDTKVLLHHDTSKVLGRIKNQTAQVLEDDVGLFYRVELPNNTLGNDTYESIKRGDIDGVSVGFRVSIQEWDEEDEDNIVRTIVKAELPEYSFTAFPAYTSSTAEVTERSNDPYKSHLMFKKNEDLNNLKRYNLLNNLKK